MQIEGHILTPGGFVRGALTMAQGRISHLAGEPISEAAVRADARTPLLLPGFIDLHVHGGGGADTMEGGDAVATLARLHAQHGSTSLLATTMTAPLQEIEAALRALAPAIAQRAAGAARVLGVHLEGPYISPDKLGAQPAVATRDLGAERHRSDTPGDVGAGSGGQPGAHPGAGGARHARADRPHRGHV